MKLVTKQEDMFTSSEPVTINAIMRLRRDVRVYTYKIPHIARFHPEAWHRVQAEMPPEVANLKQDQLFGMKVEIDNSLEDGEWYIGFSHKITREVRL